LQLAIKINYIKITIKTNCYSKIAIEIDCCLRAIVAVTIIDCLKLFIETNQKIDFFCF